MLLFLPFKNIEEPILPLNMTDQRQITSTQKKMMRAFDFQVVNPSNAWREIHYGTPRFTGMKVRIMEADWSCYSS